MTSLCPPAVGAGPGLGEAAAAGLRAASGPPDATVPPVDDGAFPPRSQAAAGFALLSLPAGLWQESPQLLTLSDLSS